MKWSFESISGGEWYVRHLLDTTKEQRVGYKDEVITVLLNPQLAPYLVKAAHFSRFPLGDYLNLQSWYSMRFYEILSAWNDTGYWEVDIDDYRQLMDCWHELDKRGQVKRDAEGHPRMKYHTTTMLIERTMQEPLRELAGTDFEFEFTPIYEAQRTGRGRRKIIRFRFDLKKPPVPKTVPQGWVDHPATGQLIKRLRDWKVTETNILKYAPVLRQEGVRALLSAWEQKDGSQRRIDDKVRYCNAAFVRMGKQLVEEAAQARRKEESEARLTAQQALKL